MVQYICFEWDKLASEKKKQSKKFWKGVRNKRAMGETASIDEVNNVYGASNFVNVFCREKCFGYL